MADEIFNFLDLTNSANSFEEFEALWVQMGKDLENEDSPPSPQRTVTIKPVDANTFESASNESKTFITLEPSTPVVPPSSTPTYSPPADENWPPVVVVDEETGEGSFENTEVEIHLNLADKDNALDFLQEERYVIHTNADKSINRTSRTRRDSRSSELASVTSTGTPTDSRSSEFISVTGTPTDSRLSEFVSVTQQEPPGPPQIAVHPNSSVSLQQGPRGPPQIAVHPNPSVSLQQEPPQKAIHPNSSVSLQQEPHR
ncbi:uncharacterized protein LOC134282246 [Saccostrea cucullata]|uniref:uncharacterized protein LOC134282246 n=1 Tax=Saccostrea cuccullata TaxID=36930 RepID=UPI002ED0F12A